MKPQERSYYKSVHVKSDAKAVFIGLTKELSHWWGQMDTPIDKLGDVFMVSWGEA